MDFAPVYYCTVADRGGNMWFPPVGCGVRGMVSLDVWTKMKVVEYWIWARRVVVDTARVKLNCDEP